MEAKFFYFPGLELKTLSHVGNFVSKCSATLASVAAPPLDRDRVSEVQTDCDTLQGVRDGLREGPLGRV